jgi:hypothetical protein
MTESTTRNDAGWPSREEMDAARERLPIRYVDAVPVRVDDHGVVTAVGLLLRVGGDGQITGVTPFQDPRQRGVAGLRGAGRGRLRSSAGRARADLVHPEEIREPAVLAELANGRSALAPPGAGAPGV